MTPPQTLENLTYRENINIFQWALYITNQTSSQNKIYLVWVDWKVNKTFFSSGDDLRENVAVRAGKMGSSDFFFFKWISGEWYLPEICGLLFHVLFKASWKIPQNSLTTPSSARVMPPHPQTESHEFSMLCLYLSVLYSVVLAVKGPWLIHMSKTFKVAGRIWGYVLKA